MPVVLFARWTFNSKWIDSLQVFFIDLPKLILKIIFLLDTGYFAKFSSISRVAFSGGGVHLGAQGVQTPNSPPPVYARDATW